MQLKVELWREDKLNRLTIRKTEAAFFISKFSFKIVQIVLTALSLRENLLNFVTVIISIIFRFFVPKQFYYLLSNKALF